MLVSYRWIKFSFVLFGLAVAVACVSQIAGRSSDDETHGAELIESFVLQNDLISIQSGDKITIPFTADLGRIQAIARVQGASIMLVVRDRSLTDNTLNVFISVRSEENDSVLLADISFFDPQSSTTDESIMSSEQPLGFFFIDVTDEIDRLVSGVGGSVEEFSLEVAVSPVHGQADRSKEFTIGRISLDAVLL